MRPRHVLTSALVAIVVAACGGGGADTDDAAPATSAADGEAVFVGTGAIAWADGAIAATAVDGQLEVTIVCEGAVPHNLLIEGIADEQEIVACEGDDEASATIGIDPGTYQFWCDVPGHRNAGMEGVLTVG